MPSEILIYQTPAGDTKIDVHVENDTVWLNQNQMADLFQISKQNVSLHIHNIFEENELDEKSTVKQYLRVQSEGSRKVKRGLKYYNLDVIISVGSRVKSHVGTHFRIWATLRLREYIIKGFVLDDERLKQARNNYFDELLSRIRDIRSSEKVFYRKVCDIFSTSIDYDASTEQARNFFATVQNKFHWAIHAHTAEELIQLRADETQPNIGLTNWPGENIKRQDVLIAKNYLSPEELEQLNRIVNLYLEFAELQAMNRRPMHMADWQAKLNAFLKLNDREILTHNGKVTQDLAMQHALNQFDAYQKRLDQSCIDELDKALKKLPIRTKPNDEHEN